MAQPTEFKKLPEKSDKALLNWMARELIENSPLPLLDLYHHEPDRKTRTAFATGLMRIVAKCDVGRHDPNFLDEPNTRVVGGALVLIQGGVEVDRVTRMRLISWRTSWPELAKCEVEERGNLAYLVRHLTDGFAIAA